MPKKMKLDTELYKRIAELQSDLVNAAAELRDLFADRSERWQESDAGMAAETWIESIENLTDELDSITQEPEE